MPLVPPPDAHACKYDLKYDIVPMYLKFHTFVLPTSVRDLRVFLEKELSFAEDIVG